MSVYLSVFSKVLGRFKTILGAGATTVLRDSPLEKILFLLFGSGDFLLFLGDLKCFQSYEGGNLMYFKKIMRRVKCESFHSFIITFSYSLA